MTTGTEGLLSLPVPTTDDPVADPLLSVLVAFFAAAINARASAAWGNLDPDKPCVRSTSTNGPERGTFVDRALPGLYIERRETGQAKWIASDWRIRPTTLVLSWVQPSVPQARQQRRDPFVNAIASALEDALEFEARDPGWVVPGDPDPRAAAEGSNLWTYAKVHSLVVQKVRWVPLIIRQAQPGAGREGATGATVAVYDRVEATLLVEERLERGPENYDVMDGIDMTLTHPDETLGDVVVDEVSIDN